MSDREEQEIAERAAQYAKEIRKQKVEEITQGFLSEENPISIFMAGAPGAGKTEVSKMLLRDLRSLSGSDNILRIDADELRGCFADYTGSNSHLFQKATSLLVHAIHDAALKRKISFLLDGTFADEGMARQNIERSISEKRRRIAHILFVYQPPQVAWEFVQKREIVEGRRIRPDDFAQKFCASWNVVDAMKKEFATKITLSLIRKDIGGANKFLYKKSIERVGDHIPEKYTKEQILAEIASAPEIGAE